MEDLSSKSVLDFYIAANKNKEKIIYNHGEGRPFSVSEEVVMACIDELLVSDENSSDRIRYLLLNSLDGSLDSLKKGEEYTKFINENELLPTPKYYDRGFYRAIGMFRESDKTYDNYLSLRNKIRQGHIYWGASGERLESILEHIYGCLVITIGIESEYGYHLDYNKILKMLLLHETEEIVIGDLTEWDVSIEDKEQMGSKAVDKVLSPLPNKDELRALIDEFNSKNTLESEYANLIDKLEYDMQVKVYELEGRYDFIHYPDNVVTRSKSVQSIINNGANNVFDVHYEYDKHRYSSVPCLRRILEETKKY